MKKLILCALLGVFGMAPAMFADIADYMLNLDGTTYCPAGTADSCGNTVADLSAAPGTTSTLDNNYGGSGPLLGTGVGNVTVTFNPGAAGNYNVDLWLFEQLATPSYNEYGTTGGTLAADQAGLSWQIDVPDYNYVGELTTPGAGTIVGNTATDSLSNTNFVPGQTDDYLSPCSGDPTCNDYVSTALGFDFTLGANQEEVLSFTVSTTAPTSGFYLEQIHPADGSNNTETDLFYTATATTEPIGVSGTPEPNSAIPLVLVAGIFFWFFRSRMTVKAS